jgi:hypothetical protein
MTSWMQFSCFYSILLVNSHQYLFSYFQIRYFIFEFIIYFSCLSIGNSTYYRIFFAFKNNITFIIRLSSTLWMINRIIKWNKNLSLCFWRTNLFNSSKKFK